MAYKILLKYLIVLCKPSSIVTLGCQLNSELARDISGFLVNGSSKGRGLKIIFELDFDILIIFSANSKILNSIGLPMLIGPVISLFESIREIIPSIVSLTKQNDLV